MGRRHAEEKMNTTSPAVQVKLSLMLIIIFSIGIGLFGIVGFEEWLRGNTLRSILQGGVAVLFLGVALLHSRKVCGLIR
jgi:hypothetical protein